MKKLSLSLFVILFFVSCFSKSEICEGELFFKLVELFPKKGFSQQQLSSINKKIEKNPNSKECKYFIKLKQYDLLGLPYINLKVNDSIHQIYLSKSQYLKVGKFSLNELKDSHKKVHIKLLITRFEKKIFFSDSIVELNIIDGETPWAK